MSSLIYHYQSVLYPKKQGIYLHEAFSTRLGELYSVNPVSVEVSGDTKTEIEESLRAMEADSVKYKPVKYSALAQEMSRWVDEVDIATETVIPAYDDEEELEVDYYDSEGKVLDICDYINRNNR